MRFDAGSRTRILVDVVTDLDPSATTVEVSVDGTWYPATWLSTPTSTTSAGRTIYKQTARTTTYFAGPSANQSGATALTTGTHSLELRITSGTDIITDDLADMQVR